MGFWQSSFVGAHPEVSWRKMGNWFWSLRPGFIQKRFFRGHFLNDLWRQPVIAEFSRTDRRARLFLRLISLLNIRFVNEFDKFMAETTATAAVAENMSLTMDAMLAIFIQFSCKHGMKWPSHHVNVIRNHEVIPVWNSRRYEFYHVNTSYLFLKFGSRFSDNYD